MLKIAAIGVMAAFLAIPLKKEKSEFSLFIIVAACLLILALAFGKIHEIVEVVRQVEQYLGKGAAYVGILLKMIGITYVAEFAANLCSDAGYKAVADQIEFYGKLMILAVSVPILMTLLETISSL